MSRYALSSCVTAAMLAGCGGLQPPIGAPGAMPQNRAVAQHTEHGGSWMLPEAKSEDLLYVTNFDSVSVFSYPSGTLQGTLTGFGSAVGECVDSNGNVFITNQTPGRIFEYAHGRTKRIATLRPGQYSTPVGCAVDPTTGDLAVTGFETNGVEIFKNARGKPVIFKDYNFAYYQFCGYDGKGNLFIDGAGASAPAFAELPKHRRTFTNIVLDRTISIESGVQWDGKYVAVGGYVPNVGGQSATIYRFRVNGSKGIASGVTPLGSPATLFLQFYILGSTLIVPNDAQSPNVLLYNYPAGGLPIQIISQGIYAPRGVVVSRASSR